MSQVTFQGNIVNLVNNTLKVGDIAPNFEFCTNDLNSITLSELKGNVIILSIVPSLDTPICQTSARKFNEKLATLSSVKIICVSKDLPFASSRFCTTEGIENVITASDFRNDSDFGLKYGVEIKDSALRGLLSRCIYVINKEGKVAYVELVSEITAEPNYEKALDAAKNCL